MANPLKMNKPTHTFPLTINKGRMKRKDKKPNALERMHMARVRQMVCVVCGKWPVIVHHWLKCPYRRTRRDHLCIGPLCPECHLALHLDGNEIRFLTDLRLLPDPSKPAEGQPDIYSKMRKVRIESEGIFNG